MLIHTPQLAAIGFLISVNNYAFLIGELPFSFHHLVQFPILENNFTLFHFYLKIKVIFYSYINLPSRSQFSRA